MGEVRWGRDAWAGNGRGWPGVRGDLMKWACFCQLCFIGLAQSGAVCKLISPPSGWSEGNGGYKGLD